MKTLKLSLLFGLLGAGLVLTPASAYTTAEAQKALTPQQAFEQLLAGNERWVAGVSAHRDLGAEVALGSKGQYPLGTVLTCLDSRTSPEQMFDQGVGDIFVGRIAGNFADTGMIGSFEFAAKLAGSKVLVVVGHSACGAVKGACDGAKMGNLTATLAQLQPALDAVKMVKGERNSKNAMYVQSVADANVKLTVEKILNESAVLADMVKSGDLGIVGGMYDLHTGTVTFYPETAHNITLP